MFNIIIVMNNELSSLDVVMMLVCVCVQVDFYISQSQAVNHAVREAACICTTYLGLR